MKHHDDRIRHLQQLEADLERQIADSQRLQRGHKPPVGGVTGETPAVNQRPGAPEQPRSRRARKRR